MKMWEKSKRKEDFGSILVSWRHRSTSRFFSKIFSWLLGAFVFALLTSIFFLAIGMSHLSQPAARIVFFVFFIPGIVSSYFRTIINGVEYWLTENAVVQLRPFSGFENLDKRLGSKEHPFRMRYFSIPWTRVKDLKTAISSKDQFYAWLGLKQTRDMKESDGAKMSLELTSGVSVEVPVKPVVKLSYYLDRQTKEKRKQPDSKPSDLDSEAMQTILQNARKANKNSV